MKKTVNTEHAAPRADGIQLAKRYGCVLGTNVLFDNLSLASKQSSVKLET
jgi:hypothetical protein